MSCLKLGNLVHRKVPTSRTKQAVKKKSYHDSEPSQLEKQPLPAPSGRRMTAKPAPRPTGLRFAAGPTPPEPGDVPTPMPPMPPPPAPAGIPDIGSDAPVAIDYPSAPGTAAAHEDSGGGGGDGGGSSWCCCCPV